MGKRRTMYGSVKKVSHKPMSSLFQDGFFMRMTLVPSLRMTFLPGTSVKANRAPQKVSTKKPMYVPSVTSVLAVVWRFSPRGTFRPG